MRKLLALILIVSTFFLFTPVVRATGIARDSYAVSIAASGTSNTLSFNNVAGDLVIAFCIYANTGDDVHNGATYNGTAMTFVKHQQSAVGGDSGMDAYILTAPSTGTHDLVCNITSSKLLQTWGVSYSGTKQSGQPDASDSASGSGTSLSSTISVVASNSWVVTGAVNRSSFASAAGSGVLTIIANDPNEASAIFDSNGTVSTGSNSYGYTGAGNNQNAMIGISIAPAVTATVSKGTYFQLFGEW